VTNDLILPHPFEIYVGIPGLQQQIAYNNNKLSCTIDGFILYLNQLTDTKSRPVSYDDSELIVTYHPSDDHGATFQGTAVTLEDTTIQITVIPPADLIGEFVMQVNWNNRPVLSKPLKFIVS